MCVVVYFVAKAPTRHQRAMARGRKVPGGVAGGLRGAGVGVGAAPPMQPSRMAPQSPVPMGTSAMTPSASSGSTVRIHATDESDYMQRRAVKVHNG